MAGGFPENSLDLPPLGRVAHRCKGQLWIDSVESCVAQLREEIGWHNPGAVRKIHRPLDSVAQFANIAPPLVGQRDAFGMRADAAQLGFSLLRKEREIPRQKPCYIFGTFAKRGQFYSRRIDPIQQVLAERAAPRLSSRLAFVAHMMRAFKGIGISPPTR